VYNGQEKYYFKEFKKLKNQRTNSKA